MPKQLQVIQTLQFDDLKAMANSDGPCVTVYLPIEKSPNTQRLEEMRLKSVVRSAEQSMAERKIPASEIRALLEPLPAIIDERDHWGGAAGGTLVLLRSKEAFRAFEVRDQVAEAVHVANHFQILPILASIEKDRLEFYLLALSQKHVRLLRCTDHGSTEVPLPKGVPTSLEEWLNTRMPNAAPAHGTSEGATNGSTAGSFTSTTDRDNKDEHLANFYRVINKGVDDMLKDQSIPLVLCGVEYERSMYQNVNTYDTLVEEGVQGSPQSLKGGEMHKRALEIVLRHVKERQEKALETYERLGGTERVSSDLVEILKAASVGRVAHLFVAEGARREGRFDDGAMQVFSDGFTEDLLNLAALRTIANSGDVFVTAPGKVPGRGPMSAVFRY